MREIIGRRAIASVAEAMSKSITSKQRKEWAAGDAEAWANAAHRVAVEKVYGKVVADGDPPKLGADYVKASMPVVAGQIKRAGVRLATILNQALK